VARSLTNLYNEDLSASSARKLINKELKSGRNRILKTAKILYEEKTNLMSKSLQKRMDNCYFDLGDVRKLTDKKKPVVTNSLL